MTSPFASYPAPERTFIQASVPGTPLARGGAPAARGTASKRGRKPKAAGMAGSTMGGAAEQAQQQPAQSALGSETGGVISLTDVSPGGTATAVDTTLPRPVGVGAPGEEDGEGEDEMLPAMAEDDYSAQASFQSQSKDNLKYAMYRYLLAFDNLIEFYVPESSWTISVMGSTTDLKRIVDMLYLNRLFARFETFHSAEALIVFLTRDQVIQQTLGQQVSQPVAQIVAGFAKVFVGEMVEKGSHLSLAVGWLLTGNLVTARAVQDRRGEAGPLSPDHLREAYRAYQQETGRVGAARPLRGKRLFVR
ncbi:hypothetical protein POSPLADRAFT_1141042 [Postia placenta MAD-698-R-SB12]|uniref:TAFII28-like protein domain-containing protein n=1 Tax=Postia placenta MAD-698-R-SB12 TaxID=670580 RepID=A0A1X6N3I2_9APHY|nr:hypothetical protein POSPLADRAFT_1141042 [Postia placenta MAD-698-R-SB12]OSX62993.1 hypothetical protein POSPLADRAFT_1141042 [Postia placenta MAD-698-R-SB12]